MDDVTRIIKLAHSVRRRAESAPHVLRDLVGWCGLTSKYLVLLASTQGIKADLVSAYFNGWSHAWVEYQGKIIDVTATQFGRNLPKVLVTSARDERYMRTTREVRAHKGYCNWQKNEYRDTFPLRGNFHNDWLWLDVAQHLHRGRRGRLVAKKHLVHGIQV